MCWGTLSESRSGRQLTADMLAYDVRCVFRLDSQTVQDYASCRYRALRRRVSSTGQKRFVGGAARNTDLSGVSSEWLAEQTGVEALRICGYGCRSSRRCSCLCIAIVPTGTWLRGPIRIPYRETPTMVCPVPVLVSTADWA